MQPSPQSTRRPSFCFPRLLGFVLALATVSGAAAAIINVTNSAGLNSALTTVNPGDEIVLANGNYSGFTMTRDGTAAAPIVIRAANRLGAVVNSGVIRFESTSYVTVEGLSLTGSGGSVTVDGSTFKVAVLLNVADNCRFTRCKLQLSGHTGSTEWILLAGNSRFNRIDHCEFGPNSVDGHLIWPRGNPTISGVTPPADRTNWANGNGPVNPNVARNTLIDHNNFHDHLPNVTNGGESIVPGGFGMTGDYQETFTVIEQNLWTNVFGDGEIISCKTSGTTIRYNTFRSCGGGPVSRAGNKTHIYGNFILANGRVGSGSIRIHEMDHLVYNNYIEGTEGVPIWVGNGDPYNGTFSHAQVKRAKVMHNTVVNCGDVFRIGNSHPLTPVDLIVANNLLLNTNFSGPVPQADWTYSQNIVWPTNPSRTGWLNVNPALTTVNGLQKLSSSSPARDAANTSFFSWIDLDQDGQVRELATDIGADEFVFTTSTRQPLTTADVGPNAPEGTVTEWEAERLTRTASGAGAAYTAENAADSAAWISFNADGAGDFIEYTLPNVPAGTYDVQLTYKSGTARGTLQALVDGTALGSLDQFATSTQFGVVRSLGTATFAKHGSHALRLTVTGRNASATAFTLSADAIKLVPTTGTNPSPTVAFEAETASPVGTGATVSTSNDANASGGVWSALNADGVGDSVEYTTPNLVAGTYQLKFKYKVNTPRGQHSIKIDGMPIGGTVDQYGTTVSYPEVIVGNVTFATAGTHKILLTVTGRNGSSTAYTLSADRFTFVGQ